jgi:secondary thiamine-phosphate synthase enzyme
MMEIIVKTDSRCVFKNITADINASIPSGFNGICHIYCCHTTAGLTINENADPDVTCDIINALNRMVPWNDIEYTHSEGNSAAHIKSSLLGVNLAVPVFNGNLVIGQWQAVYFCEFDGPRTRKILLTLLPSVIQ